MTLDQFFEQTKEKKIVASSFEIISEREPIGNDALFQLPFLAISVLLLSKLHSKPTTQEISQVLGECFEFSIKGFKDSPQQIGWSANLRIRTANAIGFLELSGLVTVDSDSRRIEATRLGATVVNKALSLESSLSLALEKIGRAYGNLRNEGKARQARLAI